MVSPKLASIHVEVPVVMHDFLSNNRIELTYRTMSGQGRRKARPCGHDLTTPNRRTVIPGSVYPDAANRTDRVAIQGDWDLLFSAVGNLLQNAFKFTPPHTEVTLNVARRSIEANDGELTVRDVPRVGCIFTISLPRRAML